MNDIQWIFFDIGGVLGDESRFKEWRLSNDLSIIQKYRPDFTRADLLTSFAEASASSGSLDSNIIHLALGGTEFEASALADLKISKIDMPDYYDWLKIRDEARGILAALSKKYKLGIMANQHSKVREKMESTWISQFFQHTEVSDDYRLEKPDLNYFKKVLESTGADPKKSVLIDDNIERGLLPAKQLGMTTVWYRLDLERRIPEGLIDFEIPSLKVLLGLFPCK